MSDKATVAANKAAADKTKKPGDQKKVEKPKVAVAADAAVPAPLPPVLEATPAPASDSVGDALPQTAFAIVGVPQATVLNMIAAGLGSPEAIQNASDETLQAIEGVDEEVIVILRATFPSFAEIYKANGTIQEAVSTKADGPTPPLPNLTDPAADIKQMESCMADAQAAVLEREETDEHVVFYFTTAGGTLYGLGMKKGGINPDDLPTKIENFERNFRNSLAATFYCLMRGEDVVGREGCLLPMTSQDVESAELLTPFVVFGVKQLALHNIVAAGFDTQDAIRRATDDELRAIDGVTEEDLSFLRKALPAANPDFEGGVPDAPFSEPEPDPPAPTVLSFKRIRGNSRAGAEVAALCHNHGIGFEENAVEHWYRLTLPEGIELPKSLSHLEPYEAEA